MKDRTLPKMLAVVFIIVASWAALIGCEDSDMRVEFGAFNGGDVDNHTIFQGSDYGISIINPVVPPSGSTSPRGLTIYGNSSGGTAQYVFSVDGHGSSYIILFDDAWQYTAGTKTLQLGIASGLVSVGRSSGKVGFYEGAGSVKQTITGNKATLAEVAARVADILTALDALGLITDSTT